jgi:hypothetical protein
MTPAELAAGPMSRTEMTYAKLAEYEAFAEGAALFQHSDLRGLACSILELVAEAHWLKGERDLLKADYEAWRKELLDKVSRG